MTSAAIIKASKAIVLLASDIGAIVNIASASDFGDSIYKSILEINLSIVRVARLAEEISKHPAKSPAKVNDISALADQLAVVVKAFRQFAQLLDRRKALNPLMPDSLMSLASQAVKDANKATALTALALQKALAPH
jgi:hypothetical protein